MQALDVWIITEEQWSKAEAYFDNKSDGEKLEKNTSGFPMSFIKIAGEIYALSNKQYFDPLGEGSFGKVKIIENKNGVKYAVKIEGRGARGDEDAETMIGKMLVFEVYLGLWLDLDEDLFARMQHRNPLERPTLIQAMSSLITELEEQHTLDTASKQVIKNLKQYIKNHAALTSAHDSDLKQQYSIALQALHAGDPSIYSNEISKSVKSTKTI